jgi:hypothetical protein
MVKYIYFLLVACCLACVSHTPIVIDNKGVSMHISFSQEDVQMNDSVIMKIALVNPTEQDVLLDSCARIFLTHEDREGFVFYDTPNRIHYLVYKAESNIVLPAKGEYVFNVKVGVSSLFFYINKNPITALLICNDYYDSKQKKIIRTQNKIHIYSNIYELTISY